MICFISIRLQGLKHSKLCDNRRIIKLKDYIICNHLPSCTFDWTCERLTAGSSYTVTVGSGDVNHDGKVTIDDLYLAYQRLINGPYDSAADLDSNGTLSTNDIKILEIALRPLETKNMASPQR